MHINIRKWGNSAGTILPASVLQEAGLIYVPDRGDIIWLDFEPGAGKKITKRRPAYVVSRKRFNEHTGLALAAPVTGRVNRKSPGSHH